MKLMYHTPLYPKLVEAIARLCYQSYHKMHETSERMVRGIMKKGHLSVAGVGNIVFAIDLDEYPDFPETVLQDLMAFKEVNNFIRWTQRDPVKNPDTNFDILVSMNALTFMDIFHARDTFHHASDLFDVMMNEVSHYPEVRWFVDPQTELEPALNPYALTSMKPGEPTVLINDYQVLKEMGLNDYELSVHATITADFTTARIIGEQHWRHTDMAGGAELSQRYVRHGDCSFRHPEDFEKLEVPEDRHLGFLQHMVADIDNDDPNEVLNNFVRDFYNTVMEESFDNYAYLIDVLQAAGVKPGRCNEIARMMLTNATTTRMIHCRPVKQWKHFFKLRLTPHAQLENKDDAEHLLRAFVCTGAPESALREI